MTREEAEALLDKYPPPDITKVFADLDAGRPAFGYEKVDGQWQPQPKQLNLL